MRFRLASLLLFVSLACCVAATSTEPSTAPSTAPSTLPSTQPTTLPATMPTSAPAESIKLADKNAQLDQADQAIRNVNADLSPEALTPQYLNDLPSYRETLKGQIDDVRTTLNSRPTVDELRGLVETWQENAAQLAAWKNDLATRIGRLDDDDTQLAKLATDWSAQQKVLSNSRVPADILTRIDTLLKNIGKARGGVDSARAQLLTPQTQVAQDYDRVNQLVVDIKAANQAAVGQLFEKDSQPIWSTLQSQKTEQVLTASQNSLISQRAALQAYVGRETGRIALHGIVTLAVILVLMAFRRQIQAWADADPDVKQKLAIFHHPVAVGLLLCMTGNAWIYPDAPRLLWLVLGPLTLASSLWLLFAVLDRSFRPVLLGMAAFYVANLAQLVVAGQPAIARVLFLIEMLAAALFVFSLIRGDRIQQMFAGRHRLVSSTLLLLLRFAGLLLIASVVLNAVGYVGLSKLIGGGVLFSALIGMIFNAAAMAIDGLIVVLFRIWPLTKLNLIRAKRDVLAGQLELLVDWAAAFAWLYLTLNLFSIRAFVFAKGNAVLDASKDIGVLELSIRNVLYFGFAIWASFALSRVIRFVLDEDVYPRFLLPRGIPYAISTVLHYTVLLLGFYSAVSCLGLKQTNFALLAGAFGVGLGFGLQNIVNNFVSGIIVLFERPLQVGDTIEIDGLTGVVSRIGIRASVVRTTAGSDLIVPNSRFIGEKVTNWTFSSGQRAITLTINIAPDTPPKVALDLLQATAASHPLVASQPPPQVLLTSFGAAAMTLELQAWTKRYEDWTTTRSELGQQVLAALAKAGIALR